MTEYWNLQKLKTEQDRKVMGFVSQMQFIVTAILGKNKNDGGMLSVSDRFNVLRRENPMEIVVKAGPFLWKYREQIKAENTSFFLNNSFEEDIVTAQSGEGRIPEVSEVEDVPILLQKIKRTWHQFQPLEQKNLFKTIQEMLRSYAGYLSVCKQIAALEETRQGSS